MRRRSGKIIANLFRIKGESGANGLGMGKTSVNRAKQLSQQIIRRDLVVAAGLVGGGLKVVKLAVVKPIPVVIYIEEEDDGT